MNKRGYEFSFAWIFAIFVGAVIIFLAVYFAMTISRTERAEVEAVSSTQITSLLNPLQTSLEEAKTATISVREETELMNGCIPPSQSEKFGVQKISTAIKSGIGDAPDFSVEIDSRSQYLFSSRAVAYENFYTLSKPFESPFKISDLIIVWGDRESYCLVFSSNVFDEIKDEISELNLQEKNILISSSASSCPVGAKTVCFGGSSCDINVYSNTRTVTKEGDTLYYFESTNPENKFALVYAAIFSSPEIYKCQIRRVMARAAILAELYKEKSDYLTRNGCGSATLRSSLLRYGGDANALSAASEHSQFSSSSSNFESLSEDLQDKNEPLRCRLF